MNGYFDFSWEGGSIGGAKVSARILFKPPGKVSDSNLAEAIEKSIQAVLMPDLIVVLCSDDELSDVTAAFLRDDLVQACDRASTKVCICVATFGIGGEIKLSSERCNPMVGLKDLLAQNSKAIQQAGLSQLFSAPYVYITAPPGFVFVKPSQSRSTRFLRAEEALAEVENVHFLAFALLTKVAQRESALKHPLDVIYIDSMAIAIVAYALRDLYCALYGRPKPRVITFHSHDGLKDLSVPLPGTSLCLISASSSLNLQRDWQAVTKCTQDEVITLLTLSSANDATSALFARRDDAPESGQAGADSKALKDLPIVGERFAPEQLLPKKVILKIPPHNIEAAAVIAKVFARDKLLSIQARGTRSTGKIRPIYVNGDDLVKGAQFHTYIENFLRQQALASTQAVIHQDDESSKILANCCAKRLAHIMQRSSPLPVIAQSAVENNEAKLDENQALLIVSAVVGRGTKLLSISRDLRNVHKGARTYLIGSQVTETQNEVQSLTKNLKYSSCKANINVEHFSALAIGKGVSESFQEEASSLRDIAPHFDGQVKHRHPSLVGSPTGLNIDALLPSTESENLSSRLKLRKDFAYWPAGYSEDDENTAAVMATIAVVLQNAREGRFENPDNRLNTDAFQQVVLSPENFARYNDGIIQASLLRLAHPSELDYSKEPASSQYMLDLLVKVFQQHDKPQGEASAEFALALRTGRLKLMREHKTEMAARVTDALAGNTAPKRLLRILLSLEAPPDDEDALPPNF